MKSWNMPHTLSMTTLLLIACTSTIALLLSWSPVERHGQNDLPTKIMADAESEADIWRIRRS